MSVVACLEGKKTDLRPVGPCESIFGVKVIVESTKNDIRINSKVVSDRFDIDRNKNLGASFRLFSRERTKSRIVTVVNLLQNLQIGR